MSQELCVVCHDKVQGFRPFWPGLKKCNNCGHCVADLDAESLDLKDIYSENYFSGDEYADYLRDRRVFEKQFQDRLYEVKRFHPSGDLIEIGCAYGFFLTVAQENYRARGFDIAAGPVAHAREHLGVDAYCADFVDAALEPESVDVVVMWDTIEHLPRPDLTIDKVVRVLRPGGFLLLTTGDIESLMARMRREKWRLIHPPTHIHYFSRRTMRGMLERVGLRVVETRYVGTRRSVRQIAYSLLALGKQHGSWLYRIMADSAIGDFSFVLNTYDIMLVVGQKT